MPTLEKELNYLVIENPWQAPFLYRKRLDGYSELIDSVNGCYPNDENYETDIILNLKAKVDENDRIFDIGYYKVRDESSGHGRPQTQEIGLTAGDISKFSRILEENTISRADTIIDTLLNAAQEKGLPGGWAIQKRTSSSVNFVSPEGNDVVVPLKRILKALEISYSYIDILSSCDFWDANPKTLNSADRDAMLALFSLVDCSDYYRIEELKKEANERAYNVNKAFHFQQLCAACEADNLSEAKKNIQFAKESILGYCSPLIYAISNQNINLIKLLLKNGASSTGFRVIEKALESGNSQIIHTLISAASSVPNSATASIAQKIQDRTILLKLLDKKTVLVADDVTLSFGEEYILKLAKYKTILWKPEHLELVYQAGKKAAVVSMLQSIAYCYLNKLGDVSERKWSRPSSGEQPKDTYDWMTIGWVISKNDSRLFRAIIDTGMKLSANYSKIPADFMTDICYLSNPCRNMLPDLFEDLKFYHEMVQLTFTKYVSERDVDKCKKMIQKYSVSVTPRDLNVSCRTAYSDSFYSIYCLPVSIPMLRFVIENYHFSEELQAREYSHSHEVRNGVLNLTHTVIDTGDSLTCSMLFEKVPELFEDFGYMNSLLGIFNGVGKVFKSAQTRLVNSCDQQITSLFSEGNSVSSGMITTAIKIHLAAERINDPIITQIFDSSETGKQYRAIVDALYKYDENQERVYVPLGGLEGEGYDAVVSLYQRAKADMSSEDFSTKFDAKKLCEALEPTIGETPMKPSKSGE